jgi:hypothetical protein
MWTFDNPPLERLRQEYQFSPSPQWLDHVRLASARLSDGGSGSFVSPRGLLLTNHHVARGQLQKRSNAQHDYIRDGFLAESEAEEIQTPDLEVNVLVSFENVTARVAAAVAQAKGGDTASAARRAVTAAIERESQQASGLLSEVVPLYQGGEYWLYRYKKYTDVRLVFAPEQQIAFFGGDSDNFTYPRHDLDMALFRVYENGHPIESADYFKWNAQGAAEGDLVFVPGNPGSTARQETIAQLEAARDYELVNSLKSLRSRQAAMLRYSDGGAEARRRAASAIFSLENSIKALSGRLKGLQDPAVMGKKRQEEQEFRARVAANPEWQRQYGGAWEMVAEAERAARLRAKQQIFRRLQSQMASLATDLVQYVAEIRKPDGARLPGFHDSELDSLRFRLFSDAPLYEDMEIARLAGGLELSVSELGAEDAFVKAVLSGRSPRQAAEAMVHGSRLADAAHRRQLVEGGEAAVAASADPMIVMARTLDPMRRELIAWTQENVEGPTERAGELLGRARFAVYGKAAYPDATFTLRLSYGKVAGFAMNGTLAPSKTTLFGLYDRAASFNYKDGWALPKRYLDGRSQLDLATPLNFVTTNDIIGGNSGSPVIDRRGELVGLIFDGNIESLAGDYVYEPASNRAVAVHTAAMTEALTKLYGARSLVHELTGQ